jgi:hypothetical protein
MTRRYRSFSLIFLFFIVMLSPKPSDSQQAKVDRREWKKLEKANWTIRQAALGNIDGDVNQALLEDIAKKDQDPLIRANATARLRNQLLLASLAVKDPVERVREEATKKLADPQLLLRILTTDPSFSVRLGAAGNPNLTDQAALADAATSDRSDSIGLVRRKALERLTDQTLIAAIAQSDTDEWLRKAAVERLSDQILLGQIAQSDSVVFEVRLKAVMKLSDQTLLARFAAEANKGIRLAAVNALTDQAVLAKLARTDSDSGVRYDAAKKLTDQAELTAVATSDQDAKVRKAAVERLSEGTVLAKIAKTDPERTTALAAAERIKDDAFLAEVAIGAGHEAVRELAVSRIDNQSVLTDIARKDQAIGVRNRAADKLTNQGVLADIARKDASPQVRITAIVRLNDQSVLAQIGRADRDWNVRLNAVKKLEDQTTLALIAKIDPHATVAELALSHLKQPGSVQLEEIVRAGATFGARMAALDRIDDPSVMETFATQGADPWIRGLATLKLKVDPSSDILIQLSTPTDPSTINLWVENRTSSPVIISGSIKVHMASGDRILTPGALWANLTVQNRNPSVSYQSAAVGCSWSLSRLSDNMSSLWFGDFTIQEVPAGATVETECSMTDDGRQTAPSGMYRVSAGRFVVKEARAFVRVPHLPGTGLNRDLDPSVLGENSSFRLVSMGKDADRLIRESPKKR